MQVGRCRESRYAVPETGSACQRTDMEITLNCIIRPVAARGRYDIRGYALIPDLMPCAGTAPNRQDVQAFLGFPDPWR
jgi:hypothetical protein